MANAHNGIRPLMHSRVQEEHPQVYYCFRVTSSHQLTIVTDSQSCDIGVSMLGSKRVHAQTLSHIPDADIASSVGRDESSVGVDLVPGYKADSLIHHGNRLRIEDHIRHRRVFEPNADVAVGEASCHLALF